MSDILLNKYVKFMRGTQAAYDALTSKDDNTLYFVYDPANEKVGALYMGDRVISGGDIVLASATLKELADVLADVTKENSFLVQREDGKWDNMAITDVAALIKENMGEIVAPAQVFQADLAEGETPDAAIVRVVNGKALTAGDIAIVKEIIGVDAADNSVAKSHTAYVYDGENWAAMDGNYSAKNVFFDEDFTFTKAIGTVTIPTSGSKKVDAKGKNLSEFFSALFAEEDTDPDKTNPSVSTFTISGGGSFEVGSVVTPSYTAKFADGSYQYGPEPTGVVVSNWKITSNNGDNISVDVANNNDQKGTLASVTIEANTSINYTATATYGAGALAKTNLGNDSTVQIAASTASKNANGAVKGYRNSFYGTLEDKTIELNSDEIRKLTASGKTLSNGSTFDVSIPVGTMRTVIAYPATLRDMTQVLDVNDSNANIVSGFGTPLTIKVAGKDGYSPVDYKVYIQDRAKASTAANTYKVTI